MPCGVRAGLAALAVLAAAAAPAAGQVGNDPTGQSQAIDRQLSQYRQSYAEVAPDEADALAPPDATRQATDAADEQEAAQQQAADNLSREQSLVADLEQRKASYAAQLDALDAESRQIAAQLRSQSTATPTTAPPRSTPTAAPKPSPPKTKASV